MIHEYYKELQNNQNIRENLSLLRSECKDPQARENLLSLVGDGALLTGLLESDEPKVRKNAALLLGSLGLLQTAGSLFSCIRERADAVRKERVSHGFVRDGGIPVSGSVKRTQGCTFGAGDSRE